VIAAETKINEFVSRLRAAGGANLKSVILYGSAAKGDHVPDISDTNLVCVLMETSFAELQKLAPAVEWWTSEKQKVPLLIGADELQRSSDVFSIELLDMQQSYRVLWGDDVLGTLIIPTSFHRVQLEYELREKTILLRQGMMMSGGNVERMWDLMLRSLPAFATLFRHALLELGEPVAGSKQEAIERLATRVGLDPRAFLDLLKVRAHESDPKAIDVKDLFARYLKEVEQVTAAVDRMLDSPKPGKA